MACLSLVMTMGLTRTAVAQEGVEIFRRALLMPRAVGLALAHEKTTSPPGLVEFAPRIGRDTYLVKNGFHLARVRTSFYSAEALWGSLTFEDDLGRRVCKAYTIRYAVKGKDHLIVRDVKLVDFTPFIPANEVYFIPAGNMSLEKLQAKSFTDLLAFARANNIHVTQEAADPMPRDYQVLVFAMDRLHAKDGWNLFADSSMGQSWGRHGWMVAGITVHFAVNGPDEVVFRVFHVRGRGSVEAGKIFTVGAFTNHYLPPIPAGPSSVVDVSSDLQGLKTRYASKAFPNLKQD